MERIGDRIAILLKSTDYTQKELASMVGVTEAAMSRYLRNEREPRIEVIANLATALNTTSDYLINGREDEITYSYIKNLVARGKSSWSEPEKKELLRLLLND
ncbi:MAG: helix-turn-helix domain-containing protein [Muribaculaceae bacterium]|nr:helix-turn-helix domain-containing protein [Muribaculaceae bacterium]MCM1532667.1 helix-turn-helix domain-containing protein [Ruminococcus flavefaciens]